MVQVRVDSNASSGTFQFAASEASLVNGRVVTSPSDVMVNLPNPTVSLANGHGSVPLWLTVPTAASLGFHEVEVTISENGATAFLAVIVLNVRP
jgi:hypothetical protein